MFLYLYLRYSPMQEERFTKARMDELMKEIDELIEKNRKLSLLF